MPLNKNRKLLGMMDRRIYIVTPTTTVSATGGPKTTTVENGPYWASLENLSRKQMETEVDTRISSIQQIRFMLRYTDTVFDELSKAGHIKDAGDLKEYNIITISKDTGRDQFIQVVTELKE